MRQTDELARERRIYREVRKKMSQLEKLWLLDVNGDYRLYIKRLHHLAAEYKIPISEPDTNQ